MFSDNKNLAFFPLSMLRSSGSSEFPTSKSYKSNNHRKFVALLLLKQTVEPLCATTSHKRTPIHKTKNFTSQSLTVGTSSKRPPPVSDRDHFLGLTVNDFPFIISGKRSRDAFPDLYVRCAHDASKNKRRTLETTWDYTRA